MWRWRVCVLLVAVTVVVVALAIGSASALRINGSVLQSFSYRVNLTVAAEVTLSPDALSAGSDGAPITAHIRLPTGYDPAGIVRTSPRLCYAPVGCVAALPAPGVVADGQRIVTFARADVLGLLAGVRAPATVMLTVVGMVTDGASYRPFSGSVSPRLLADG